MASKLSNSEKLQIISLLEKKKDHLKSYSAVATFLNVSPSVVSQMAKNIYQTQNDDLWFDVGIKLGWKPEVNGRKNEWQLIDTFDTRSIETICTDAKEYNLFLTICDEGGIGKTQGLKKFIAKYPNAEIYYIRCMEWTAIEFMEQLCRTLGIAVPKGYNRADKILQLVVDFFNQRSAVNPLLICDEVGKLKDSAKRKFIPLYNECEDSLGIVCCSAEDYERDLLRGVKYAKKGYDEILSRFNRSFIKLRGTSLNEVIAIANANGYFDTAKIKEAFKRHKPTTHLSEENGQPVALEVMKDIRWIKPLVKINRK